MRKIIQDLNNYTFFLIFYVAFLATALIHYYTKGCFILGGEGNFVLNFATFLKNFSFMWFPNNCGMPNIIPCGVGLNIFILWIVEKLTKSLSITNFVLIFSIYFFPFLAMFLVSREFKTTPFVSFLISFFYIVNAFTLYYLISLNQWCVFSLTVMPLFLWIILKYYRKNFKLFFIFGIVSMLFSFTYANPPTLVVILVSVALSVFVGSYYNNKKFALAQIFKRCVILFMSFIVFNSWWILGLISNLHYAQKIYTHQFAEPWLNTSVGNSGLIIAKMFFLTTTIINNCSYDFFTYWYNTIFAKLIVLIPIFIVVYFVLISKNKRTKNLLNVMMFVVLLSILFLAKGNTRPFGFIYNWMFDHLPFFYIFKSPVEKFGILYIFVFSILLLLVIHGIKNQKYYKSILCIFVTYLIFCSIPIITGNIIPDYRFGDGKHASRKYKDKLEYRQFRKHINNDISDYRILSLPGSGNYQVCMRNWNNKYYTGLDPVLMNIDKPFVSSYSGVDVLNLLFQNISVVNYRKLLSIYNIKKVIINEDLIPWFGFIETESIPELKNIFGKFMTSKKLGAITIYNNKDNFLPLIYVSPSLRINNKK